jgi:hypothetical protein
MAATGTGVEVALGIMPGVGGIGGSGVLLGSTGDGGSGVSVDAGVDEEVALAGSLVSSMVGVDVTEGGKACVAMGRLAAGGVSVGNGV